MPLRERRGEAMIVLGEFVGDSHKMVTELLSSILFKVLPAKSCRRGVAGGNLDIKHGTCITRLNDFAVMTQVFFANRDNLLQLIA